MIKQIITIIGFICIIQTSCKNITTKDISIIEDIKLGTSVERFYNQCDSLKIQQKIFYTKDLFSSSENLDDYRMKFYVSDIFNTNEYNGGSQTLQHYGLFYPIVATGTKNIAGLNVLLVYTSNAQAISSSGFTPLTTETNIPGISQNMSNNQIDGIADLLTEKYGKPISTLKNQNISFYVFEKNQIREYSSDSSNIGEMIIWKTKYLNINLFKGIASGTDTYNSKNHSYLTYIDFNPFREIKYEEGERPCRSYGYISYQLNDLAIKELELRKVKL